MMESLFEERFTSIDEALEDLFDLSIYVNGKFLKGEQARLSAWDHGLLYGDGVFEGIRAYSGKIFRLREHLDRLYDSAHCMGIHSVPLSPIEMQEAIFATVRQNKISDGHIKVVVTRGVGRMGHDPRRARSPSVLVYAYPYPPTLGEKPVRLITSSVRRKAPLSIDSRVKTLCYVDNVLASLQSITAGVEDAIMLDPNGFVAEATGTNIFAYRRGCLYTPRTYACLPGITREVVLQIADDMQLKAVEQDMTVGDLYVADEVFLTGTAAEIVPVAEIDGREIGIDVPGPIVRELIERYRDLVERESQPVD